MDKLKFFAILLSWMMLVACGDDNMVQAEEVKEGGFPEWYMEVVDNDAYYFGKATAASKRLGVAEKQAYADAKAALVNNIKASIKTRIRNAVKSSGSLEMGDEQINSTFDSAVETTAEMVLEDVKPHRRTPGQVKGGIRIFLCLKVSKKKVAETALAEIKKDVKAKVSDPNAVTELNALFDDDFFKNKK